MTGLRRVAVQVGTSVVRVAALDDDGPPTLVAELPAPAPTLPALLGDLVGPVPELVLVHPAAWPSTQVAALARSAAGLAGRIRTVPAPVAVGAGPRTVLDVGHSGAEATRVGGDGRILVVRTAPAGGAALDAALAEVLGGPSEGGVREELSLHPGTAPGLGRCRAAFEAVLGGAVDALREVAGPGPVLLVGGVARMPLLAELVDAAGIHGAVVVARPDAAAVLGALAVLPAVTGPPGPSTTTSRLPPLPPRRSELLRVVARSGALVASAVALVGLGWLLPIPATATAAPPPAGGAPPVGPGVLVQYGYRLDVPAGWEHTGGLPERRRSLLTPVGAPQGSDLIAVERSPLGYDAGAEPERAAGELRATFDDAVAAGSVLSDYDPTARVGGRAVTVYTQRDGATVVDWAVVLDGDAQLSVGCQHTPAGAAAVRGACALVVVSVRRG